MNPTTTMDHQQPYHHPHHYFTSAPSLASRASSVASTTSPPITPTFSAKSQSHTRWPSSSSSLTTTSDSPSIAASKTTLHDLVEDPSERDDVSALDLHAVTTEELFCMCDTAFCEHRRICSTTTTSPIEWTPGDDFFPDSPTLGEPRHERRRSGDVSIHSLTHRLSRRLPSLSRRWHAQKAPASPADVTIRSAPLSRASSFKHPHPKPSATTAQESLGALSTAASSRRTSITVEDHQRIAARRISERTTSAAQPLEIAIPARSAEELIDRSESVGTPLLPPIMDKHFTSSAEELQSPLQEPTVAPRKMTDSWNLTPNSTAYHHPGDVLTPPLSTKNSQASLHHVAAIAASEIPPLSLARPPYSPHHQPSPEEQDPYSAALGHANFTIHPAPHCPPSGPADPPITAGDCQRLLADWEAARKHYLRCAADISRHYGPTSVTFQHAEAKWAALDAQWRAFHARACAAAAATHERQTGAPLPPAALQSLAPPSQKSLHAAAQAVAAPEALHRALAEAQIAAEAGDLPAKFPCVAREEMVGSMVQYAKMGGVAGGAVATGSGEAGRTTRRKPVLLRIFTDPKSLLFGGAK